MSSSDPRTGAPRPGDGFAPLPRANVLRGARAASSVFPDLQGPPAGADDPSVAAPDADAHEAARQEAYAAGLADGRAARDAEIAAGATAFADAVEEVARFRRGLLERYQRELLELAL